MIDRSQAGVRLQQVIDEHRASAAGAVQHALDTVPRDSVVRASALRFSALIEDDGLLMQAGAEGQDVQTWGLHRHALGQIAESASVPMTYVDTLLDGEGWQRELLADVLTTTYTHSTKRHLVRAVGDEARGFLSDRYRRLDTRPILDAFFQATAFAGAVPFSGVATDIRTAVKVVLPHVFEPIAGEFVAYGLEWLNSDFGAARYSLRAFLLRLVCINGATAEDLLSQVHLGGRLPDEVTFTEQTYAADQRAMTLATRDVVRGALSDGGIRRLTATIGQAASRDLDTAEFRRRVAAALSKDELRRASESFAGPDVVNLPAGQTAWRASNALSWLARATDDSERRLDLERLAGTFLKTGNGNGDTTGAGANDGGR